jgi:hypothetical protein
VSFVIRSGLCVRFPGHKAHEEDPFERLPDCVIQAGIHPAGTKGHKAISNLHLLHFIHRLCQLMSKAISFGFVFSFLYGIKLIL